MNKLVYLCLSILELSKIVMYDFWCDYVKLKFGGKTKTKQNVSMSIQKQMISLKTLQKIL